MHYITANKTQQLQNGSVILGKITGHFQQNCGSAVTLNIIYKMRLS